MDLTSLLSLLIAAATLVVVLIQERRHRRRVSPAIWSTTRVGTRTDLENGTSHEIIKIEQNGSHMVSLYGIWSFGCKVQADHEYRLRSTVFRPGDTVELLFETDDINKAWILVVWHSREDKGRGATEWIPLTPTSSLAETMWEQRKQELAKSRWQLWLERHNYRLRRVGPDYFLHRPILPSSRAHRKVGKMADGVLLEDTKESTGVVQ